MAPAHELEADTQVCIIFFRWEWVGVLQEEYLKRIRHAIIMVTVMVTAW